VFKKEGKEKYTRLVYGGGKGKQGGLHLRRLMLIRKREGDSVYELNRREKEVHTLRSDGGGEKNTKRGGWAYMGGGNSLRKRPAAEGQVQSAAKRRTLLWVTEQ